MLTKSEKSFLTEGADNFDRLPRGVIAAAVPLAFFSLLLFGKLPGSVSLVLPLAVYVISVAAHRSKKVFIIVSSLFACLELVLILFFRKYLAEGMNRFTNEIYKLSEERQAYIYTMYEVSKDKKFGAASDKLFAVFIIILAALFFAHCALKSNRIAPFGFLLAFAVTEIYYGIFPSPFANVMVYAGIVLLIVVMSSNSLNPAIQAIAAIVVALAVISAATYLIYPAKYRERNPAVSELNDRIRDFLEEGVPAEEKQKPEEASQQQEGETVNPDETETPDDSEETGPENPEKETEPQSEPSETEPDRQTTQHQGSETDDQNAETAQPYNPEGNSSTKQEDGGEKFNGNGGGMLKKVLSVFLFIILIMVLIVLAWAAAVAVSRRSRQKKLEGENREASLYAFEQSVKLLGKLGFNYRNVPYSARIDEAEEMVYDGYGQEFEKAIEIRERILYGGKPATDKDREDMIIFYTSTRTAVLASSDSGKQFVIKYVNLL